MSTVSVPTSRTRLRHPAFYVWLFGGLIGSGLNLIVTLLLALGEDINLTLAFFIGTLVNELFHHVYYHVVYVNQEIRLRTPLPIQLTLYVIVAAVAAGLPWAIRRATHLHDFEAVLAALVVLAVFNSVISRVSTFSSATLAMVEYKEMGETFYDDQTDPAKVNFVRAWFHRQRQQRLTAFVDRYYRPGDSVADLGCGNCWWNVRGLPVTGVDVNVPMMTWAKDHGRLAAVQVTDDLSRTGLPDRSQDIVIMSETLEHLINFEAVIAEVGRVLKPTGTYLITVPYDFFLGPFFVMFNVNCLWQGYVRGSVYHRYRCGHINHFTRGRLIAALRQRGFDVTDLSVVNGLTLYAAATRRP